MPTAILNKGKHIGITPFQFSSGLKGYFINKITHKERKFGENSREWFAQNSFCLWYVNFSNQPRLSQSRAAISEGTIIIPDEDLNDVSIEAKEGTIAAFLQAVQDYNTANTIPFPTITEEIIGGKIKDDKFIKCSIIHPSSQVEQYNNHWEGHVLVKILEQCETGKKFGKIKDSEGYLCPWFLAKNKILLISSEIKNTRQYPNSERFYYLIGDDWGTQTTFYIKKEELPGFKVAILEYNNTLTAK